MEGLRKRVIGVGLAFLALGLAFQLRGSTQILHDGQVPDEKWLQKQAPKSVDNYKMMILDNGTETTYRMTQVTYDTLHPYGIVARVMENGTEKYDTVVIMSNKKDSFHDPRFCFTSQGWALDSQEDFAIDTKAHGRIHVTMAQLNREGVKTFAAYFYRGPSGFTGSNQKLKLQMLWHQIVKFEDAEAVFYRFIPMYDGASKEKLARFIDQFLSASEKSSKGLL